MTGAMVQISSKSVLKSSADFGTKNALARIIRRRWQANTVCMVMAEWDLTEGEAKGCVYAQASQRTLDKIKKHKNGGWPLVLEIEALVLGMTVEQFIEERRRYECEQYERIEGGLRKMASDLPAVLRVGSPGGH